MNNSMSLLEYSLNHMYMYLGVGDIETIQLFAMYNAARWGDTVYNRNSDSSIIYNSEKSSMQSIAA